LVVDDDPAVLEFIAQILRGIPGSEVVACDNPCQALKVFSAAPESFELLVTDFDMPGLDGIQLARHVRAGFSRVQILLISGSEVQATDALSAGVDAFLPKPFPVKELLAMVRGLINQCDRAEGWPRRRIQFWES